MGVGSIFVATTIAPLVVILASVSLQLLTIGLEQLSKWSSHTYDKNALWPLTRKINYIINTKCFGDMEIDLKSFNNVMLMAILMALIGVALSVASVEDSANAARAASRAKSLKNGTTPTKAKKIK